MGGSHLLTVAPAPLSEEARALLVQMLRAKPRTIVGVRGITPPRINLGSALTELEKAGFIGIGQDGLHYPAPPGVINQALQTAIAAHHDRLATARTAVELLGRRAHELPPAQRPRPPVPQPAYEPSTTKLVRFGNRIIIEGALLHHADERERARCLAEEGGAVAVVRALPHWLAGFQVNVSALADLGEAAKSRRPTIEAQALSAAFEDCWAGAVPYPASGSEAEFVLGACGLGFEDLDIARMLGLPVRRVQRIVHAAMNQQGARTRFELAVHTATASRRPAAGPFASKESD